MLLAGLILLAACANLGSLFAARAADRSREVALRLALGSSRRRILRQLFTEAVLISLARRRRRTVGQRRAVARAERVAAVSQVSPQHAGEPGRKGLCRALLLALVSGFLFGVVPVRQVLAHQSLRDRQVGINRQRIGRRITVRDLLLVVQIAICAVLVTSSMVAVRGLVRSLHSNFGFEPRNAMLVDTDLTMAGYSGDQVPAMQKRMIDAVADDSRRGVCGIGRSAAVSMMARTTRNVFTDKTTDLRPSNAAADAIHVQHLSRILPRGRHSLAGGQELYLA